LLIHKNKQIFKTTYKHQILLRFSPRCIGTFSLWIHTQKGSGQKKIMKHQMTTNFNGKNRTWIMHVHQSQPLFYRINYNNPSRCHSISITLYKFFSFWNTLLQYLQYPRRKIWIRPEITLQMAKIPSIINATKAKSEKVHKHKKIHKIWNAFTLY
jgi:hypothetical protein